MARVVFDNLTIEQARCLAHWFEGEGEQSCEVWFDCHELPSPRVDVHQKMIVTEDEVIVPCRTP